MINKIKNLLKPKKELLSKEKQNSNEYSVKRVYPRQTVLFGKVLSFSVDSNSVQMAASIHYGRSFTVLEVCKEYFTPSSESAKNIEDFYEQCIIEFTQRHKSYFTKIFLTLKGESSLYRSFLLPELRPKELSSAIQFEVKRAIPFPIEESIYDYRVIQKIQDPASNRVKISLHASTKENIYKQLAPFQKNNIKVDKILHSHDTIGQLLGLLKDFDKNKIYTLINIGKKTTEISFYHGKALEFSRSNTMSTDILGFNNDSTKLEYFTEAIANEIQTSLDYYSGQLSANSNNSILLYGDFAYSTEFIELLNDKLDVVLERFPIDKLKVSYRNNEANESFPVCLPVFATSINHTTLPDLLPTPLKQEHKVYNIYQYFKTAAAILIVTLAASWSYMDKDIIIVQNNHDALEEQISLFKKSEAYHTYKLIKQEIAFDRIYIDLAKESSSFMNLNLKELSRIIPENIKLFNLDYNPKSENKNYFIQGIVLSDDIPPEITLAEFIENLSSSKFYENVQIVRHVKKKKKSSFEIEFLIEMKGIV